MLIYAGTEKSNGMPQDIEYLNWLYMVIKCEYKA